MSQQHPITRRGFLQQGAAATALAGYGGAPNSIPLHAFCGTGDHLWVRHKEPVDSRATIEAMIQWMAETYNIRRLYWRGGQTMMWDKHVKVGKESPLQYDWTAWKHHLYNDLRINEAAIRAAKRHGMEIFLYTGLFEFGVQPDIGIVGPYLFEDELRIKHPEWCSVDRWNQRRCPGPISFGYREAQRAIVDRYAENVDQYGYDGMCFYTYVENCGIRYKDEFGFEQPVVNEFNKKYPNVDLRSDELTAAQKLHWYQCRGLFVTEFLRWLHARLAAHNKKISVILDASRPNYVQPWWGKPIAGTGEIQLDWWTWVDDRFVDELWVQLGPAAKQRATLDLLLKKCQTTDVKLTVRTTNPFDPAWRPYIHAGVTPIAVITSPRNGIERYSLKPTSNAALSSTDWCLRLQAVADVEKGKLHTDNATVAKMATDPHVLVRRRTMYALAALHANDQIAVLERGLFDRESSVRMAAAGALASVHNSHSPERIFSALEKDGYFQMKMACVDALSSMKDKALPYLIQGLQHRVYAVREVCVRALYGVGKAGLHDRVYLAMRTAMLDRDEDERVRHHAIEGLVGLRIKLVSTRQQQLATDLMKLAIEDPSTAVALSAARGLGYMHGVLSPALRKDVVRTLVTGFQRYGDGCSRPDAAFGWRLFGNALLQYHGPGRARLEAMCSQREDHWLAWIAYEVMYLPHRAAKIDLVDQRDAVRIHRQFAPPMPGYRTW